MLETFSSIANGLRQNYRDESWLRFHFAEEVLGRIHGIADNRDTINIRDEQWDSLLILDGCRPDLFESTAAISEFDDYRQVESLGSHTSEWIQKNFEGDADDDIVYINGSPQVSRSIPTAVHRLVEVWRDQFDAGEVKTVPASAVSHAARHYAAEYPDKHLIIHYMQPHYPFVTEPDLQYAPYLHSDAQSDSYNNVNHVWDALCLGLVDESTVWDAYKENLEYVLDEAIPLANELEGRTVITSDHGNLFGERPWLSPIRLYGHPRRVRHPQLTTVPWAVIGDESPSERTSDGDIKGRLEALGYA